MSAASCIIAFRGHSILHQSKMDLLLEIVSGALHRRQNFCAPRAAVTAAPCERQATGETPPATHARIAFPKLPARVLQAIGSARPSCAPRELVSPPPSDRQATARDLRSSRRWYAPCPPAFAVRSS